MKVKIVNRRAITVFDGILERVPCLNEYVRVSDVKYLVESIITVIEEGDCVVWIYVRFGETI